MAKAILTPGPWQAVEVGDTGGDNPVGVFEVQTADGRRRVAEHLSEADAKVVAATPRLLDALEKMVQWYGKRDGREFGDDELLPPDEQEAEVREAIAAISAATDVGNVTDDLTELRRKGAVAWAGVDAAELRGGRSGLSMSMFATSEDYHAAAALEATDEMIDAACAAVPSLYRVDAMRALEAALAAGGQA